MHTEKPGRNIKREKREREKKKRLVIAALYEKSMVQGYAGPRKSLDCLCEGHHTLVLPTAHILCHSPFYPFLFHSLADLSQALLNEKGSVAPPLDEVPGRYPCILPPPSTGEYCL